MLEQYFSGLRLVPSKSAYRELFEYGLRMGECKKILENGYEPRKRGKDVIEKWQNVGNKTYNIVIVRSYSRTFNEDVYVIKHVGRFSRK